MVSRFDGNDDQYCTSASYGTVDNKITLDPEDDAASVNWGGAWCMPTRAEQDELRNKCSWTWTSQNGVNGYKVKGPNGNTIFLPAAGYIEGDRFPMRARTAATGPIRSTHAAIAVLSASGSIRVVTSGMKTVATLVFLFAPSASRYEKRESQESLDEKECDI